MLRHCLVSAGSAISYSFVDEELEIAKIQQDLSKFLNLDDGDDSHQKENANVVEDAVEFSMTTKEEIITNANMKRNPFEFSSNATSHVGNGEKFELGNVYILESRVFVSQVVPAISDLHE